VSARGPTTSYEVRLTQGGAVPAEQRSATRLLAVALLLGAAVVATGAAMHPMLAGDAATQLRTIAGDPHWRGLHLAMLAGSALVIAGVWTRLLDRPPEFTVSGGDVAGSSRMLIGALVLVSIGLTVNALNIAFMAGAGWRMAARFQQGDPAIATLFDLTHPIGLVAARFGNAIVALGALVLGVAERRESDRWLPALAWVAAVGGTIGVVFFDESSRAALAAVALLTGWEVAVAIRALRGAHGLNQ